MNARADGAFTKTVLQIKIKVGLIQIGFRVVESAIQGLLFSLPKYDDADGGFS